MPTRDSYRLSQGVEPVSEWKSPDSIQMSLVSYFFKLSMVLRNVHSTLTEDYQVLHTDRGANEGKLLEFEIRNRNWVFKRTY